MSYEDRAQQAARKEPGSAQTSEVPAGCTVGVLLIVAVFCLSWYRGDATLGLLSSPIGMTVASVWGACAVGLVAVGGWASYDKRSPQASLADLMPQRVIGSILFAVAMFAGLLLGI